MIDVVMVRHAMTAWNESRRIQGQTDIPLSDQGRRALSGRRLPARFESYRVYSSPLARATETAVLLGLATPVLDPRLMEMHWGEWEGRTRAAVAAEDARGVASNEARGPDFRPPGGESPREVQARVVDWARNVARTSSHVVAVTHKGVIKATLGLACGWDLNTKSPVRLDWSCAHRFGFDPNTGAFALAEPNIRLAHDARPPVTGHAADPATSPGSGT